MTPASTSKPSSSSSTPSPPELAERHLGWRLIEAFVARDPAELLFWSVAFAKFEGTADAEIVEEVLAATVPDTERSN